jgi:hypothetical protein
MAKEINAAGVGLRFVAALLLVLASYNPEGVSYYHWALQDITSFSVLKGFIGVVLLIGWTMFIRATLHSLGPVGIGLAVAFFGTLLWLVVDWGLVPSDSIRAISYLVLIAASGVLTAGMSWSHIRRRVSGQFDVDETDEG